MLSGFLSHLNVKFLNVIAEKYFSHQQSKTNIKTQIWNMGFMDDDRMIKFQNVKTLDQNIFPQFFS